MKKMLLTMSVLALALGSCKKAEDKSISTTTVNADTLRTETPEAEKPMDSVAMMKAWQDYATPGEVHKVLASDVGKWDCEMSFWEGPDAKAQKAMVKADITMFDGKYQEARYAGDMMGMAFVGKGTMGYNNASGKVFSTFYDNMGTGIMYGEGSYDSAKKMFSLSGEMTDPMSKKQIKYREEYVIVDSDTRKMSMFDTKNGTEYKSMEIVLKRSK